MKKILLASGLILLIMVGVMTSCAPMSQNINKSSVPGIVGSDYKIERLSPEVFIVIGMSETYTNIYVLSLAAGVKEIGENYVIKKIVPISYHGSKANPTGAVFVFVEPRK